jgi:hypothetical protein
MKPLVSNSVRLGAAAFVMGLCLAGPQAAVAAATPTDGDSSSNRVGRSEKQTRQGVSEAKDSSVGRSRLGAERRSQPGPAAALDSALTAIPAVAEVRAPNKRPARSRIAAEPIGPELYQGPALSQRSVLLQRPAGAVFAVAPKAATAPAVVSKPAAAVVAGPSPEAVVDSGQTTVLGEINAAINVTFDSLTNLINDLPLGVVGDLLTGALQLIRRTFFNQAPSAVPVQWGQTISDIEGTIGGFDPEGDAITYTITEAPEYGVVTINSDGSYSYVPSGFTESGTIDSFTVGVADSAWRLLGPITTQYVVPVTVNPASNPPAVTPNFATQGFTLYNWTSGDLEYIRAERDADEIDNGPSVGTKVGPGHSFHFEIDVPLVQETVVRPVFKDANGNIWAIDLVTDKNLEYGQLVYYTGTQSCFPSNQCNSGGVTSYPISRPGNIQAEFLDKANTVINVTAADKQKQADILNTICVGGTATCTYRITSTTDPFKGSKQLLGSTAFNESDAVATKTFSYTVTESATTSWDVTASAKTTLFKMIEASLAVKYGQSWTTTATFGEVLTQPLPPWSYGALFAQPFLTGVYGDFTVKLGNTTWNLKDVLFDYPTQTNCKDKVCQGSVLFRAEPLQRGFRFLDPDSKLPFEPVYEVGGQAVQLQVRAFNGFNNPPWSDYTPNMSYKTSDPAVATVSKTGVLTPVGVGTAKITANYSWQIADQTLYIDVELPVKVTPPPL